MSLQHHLAGWEPAPRTDHDLIAPAPVAALSAVLDLPTVAGAGDPLPPLWHWLHFLDWPPQRELGPDGHPTAGHFLPPIPDRRRMFAGGRLHVERPLTVGEPAHRVSTLQCAVVKHGRTGEMVFVTVRGEFRQADEIRVVEELDFVYRSGEDARRTFTLEDGHLPTSQAAWQLPMRTDPALLFRFSALTANTHRIHYDAPYARETESYPGLVVHGPLLVLLMLELVRRHEQRPVRSVGFRLRRPVFCGEPVLAHGEPAGTGAELSVLGAGGHQHATARVDLG
jgi:3-methylfumaryl-CoA hydratase